jgi:hypothetical protein
MHPVLIYIFLPARLLEGSASAATGVGGNIEPEMLEQNASFIIPLAVGQVLATKKSPPIFSLMISLGVGGGGGGGGEEEGGRGACCREQLTSSVTSSVTLSALVTLSVTALAAGGGGGGGRGKHASCREQLMALVTASVTALVTGLDDGLVTSSSKFRSQSTIRGTVST